MFGELPADRSRRDDAVLERARERAREALKDEDLRGLPVDCLLPARGDLRGCDLWELSPNHPYAFSATDLLAVTMLSVEIPQGRRSADSGAWADGGAPIAAA